LIDLTDFYISYSTGWNDFSYPVFDDGFGCSEKPKNPVSLRNRVFIPSYAISSVLMS